MYNVCTCTCIYRYEVYTCTCTCTTIMVTTANVSKCPTSLSQDYGNKRTTLYDIRDELFSPYKERRKAYQPLSPEDKFSLLTGKHVHAHAHVYVYVSVVYIVCGSLAEPVIHVHIHVHCTCDCTCTLYM